MIRTLRHMGMALVFLAVAAAPHVAMAQAPAPRPARYGGLSESTFDRLGTVHHERTGGRQLVPLNAGHRRLACMRHLLARGRDNTLVTRVIRSDLRIVEKRRTSRDDLAVGPRSRPSSSAASRFHLKMEPDAAPVMTASEPRWPTARSSGGPTLWRRRWLPGLRSRGLGATRVCRSVDDAMRDPGVSFALERWRRSLMACRKRPGASEGAPIRTHPVERDWRAERALAPMATCGRQPPRETPGHSHVTQCADLGAPPLCCEGFIARITCMLARTFTSCPCTLPFMLGEGAACSYQPRIQWRRRQLMVCP